MMGAGGITETITCVKAIETGTVPPTINLNEVDPNVPALTLLQIPQRKPKSTLPCQTHSDSAVRTQVLS